MLRDDLMIVIPDFVFDEGGMLHEWGAIRPVKHLRTFNWGPHKAASDAAYPKMSAWLRTFETDPETIVMLPDGVGVQIKRATLGELRIWQKTHATTVPSWRRFLDTFETFESPKSSLERSATRLERVKAKLEDDTDLERSILRERRERVMEVQDEDSMSTLRPFSTIYRRANLGLDGLTIEVDDPTGDDVAADAPRRLFAGGGGP